MFTKGSDVLRLVEAMHQEKQIARDLIFDSIQAALQLAAEKHYGDDGDIVVTLDRDTGELQATHAGQPVEPGELGRIAAQSAKQLLIQKIREAETTQLITQYQAMKGDLVHGTLQRYEGGAGIVSLGKSEAILPRSESIPGETHHPGERIKAVVLDVKKAGHRVKIILSRTHPDFVRRLFEHEIPEIADKTIEIRAVAREAGYRSKIAVSSIDMKVDCVGACVGVRGSRIKNVVEELNNERIDIVRWNDSLQVMIPNALQPAQIEEVFLYPRLGRAIVLVKEDQLSLAIGKRGQNVRLASKLVGWDIEIMTHDELNNSIEKAENWFSQIQGVQPELVEVFIEEGFLSYDDLTFLEPSEMAELSGLSEDEADDIIAIAEEKAEEVQEENRTNKTEQTRAGAVARSGAGSASRSGAPRAEDIFGPAEPAEQQPQEHKPTAESLFGPDTAAPEPEEPRLTAAQVFGDEPAPAPTPDAVAVPTEETAPENSVPSGQP